jgi:hypothetical protein
MWLLRSVRKNRWENRRGTLPLDVAEAAKDLSIRRGKAGQNLEDYLSVFEVQDEDDGERIATLLGAHKKRLHGHADHVDYLLVPPDSFKRFGLTIIVAPDASLSPELSERHRGVEGMTDAIALSLAEAILTEGRCKLGRIKKQHVEKAANQ